MMDETTLRNFEKEVVEGTVSEACCPSNLTNEEKILFEKLKAGNIRLEQEKISQKYVLDSIQHVLIKN